MGEGLLIYFFFFVANFLCFFLCSCHGNAVCLRHELALDDVQCYVDKKITLGVSVKVYILLLLKDDMIHGMLFIGRFLSQTC